MTGSLRRQQLQSSAVQPYAVHVRVVRVTSPFSPDTEEVDPARPGVHPQHARHVPGTGRNRILHPSRLRIVEIQMAPAVTFRKPDDFTRFGKVSPVDDAVARLEVGRRLL